MDNTYWLNKWKKSDTKFDQDVPNQYLVRYLENLNLPSGSRIFVPLCGKSIDMFWLLHQGFKVVGIELSPIACEGFFKQYGLAYKQTKINKLVKYEGEKIILYAGDYFALNKDELGTINAIYDRASLIALPEQLRGPYVELLFKLIEPNTQILLLAISYDQNEMQGPPFSVNEAEVKKLFNKHACIEKLVDIKNSEIPQHLAAKGLTKASEQIYHITKK